MVDQLTRNPRSKSTVSLLIAICLILPVHPFQAGEKEMLGEETLITGGIEGPFRRLFLDALLVEQMQGLERVFHACEKHPNNPLIIADTPWEKDGSGPYLYGTVLHDEGKLRMWYHFIKDGYRNAYAESKEGIHWIKPDLGIIEYEGSRSNNLFLTVTQDPAEEPVEKWRGQCHNPSVIRIPDPIDPQRRYALFTYGADWGTVRAAFSPDGVRWTFVPETARKTLFESSDVVNFFFDLYNNRFAATWKGGTRRGRSVGIAFSQDGLQWQKPSETAIFTADDNDPPQTQIYGMPVFPYQGLYIGLPWIYHALPHYIPEMHLSREEAEDQSTCTGDVQLAWSWDLINWTRPPERQPFVPLGEPGAFDSQMIYTARAPVVVNGMLCFYYGGFDVPHNAPTFNTHAAIGLATLRLDGFCSMRAGEQEGWLITRREALKTPALWINARIEVEGYLRAEILDSDGQVIPGFSAEECETFQGDSTRHLLRWQSKEFPELLRDQNKKIRFFLKKGDLYSYWLPDTE